MKETYRPEGYLIDTPENREYLSSMQGLEYAYAAGITLEARAVLCDNNHDLIVELGSFRGVIPHDEVLMTDGGDIREIAVITRVGKPVCFKIVSLEKGDNDTKIVLSRKMAQEECYAEYISKLRRGDIIDAKITHEEQFGCFCDIGCGIISLLSVDCISVSRISHPRERFYVGQYIRAIVRTTVENDGRISLSHKELLGTWEENASRFLPGETTTGIIRSIEPYGIFIELAPNLAGLAEWREGVCEDQPAAIYIKSIIPEKMKIKLVIIDCHANEKAYRQPEYFVKGDHIDFWRYSPDCCEKVIETVF